MPAAATRHAPAAPPETLRGQRLLLVGAHSYIGSRLAEYASARGAVVTSVTSSDCDFLDRRAVERLFGSLQGGPHAVVFLAVVNKPVRNSFESFLDNVRMVQHLVEGCQRQRAAVSSLTYFSSVDVYGNRPAVPITEASRLDPDSWYGQAKATGEWMLTRGGFDFPVAILRVPGVYGPAAQDRSVIGRIVSSVREGRPVTITGDGAARRDYVFREDVCRLVERLLPMRYDGVLNVATGTSYAVRDIVRLAGQAMGRDARLVHGPSDPARDFDLAFDTARLASVVKDFRFTALPAGLRSYLST